MLVKQEVVGALSIDDIAIDLVSPLTAYLNVATMAENKGAP